MSTAAIVKWLTDYSSAHSFGSWLRQRRSRILLQLISRIHARNGRVDIIDVGGTVEYWNILPSDAWDRFKLVITLVNRPEIINGFQVNESGERFFLIQGDGCNLSEVEDRKFHLAHSNSVLEHVGNSDAVRNFCRELRRVALDYYLQTPDFHSLFEPHFFCPCFHRLPLEWRICLLRHFTLGFFDRQKDEEQARLAVESIHLLSESELKELFPGGIIWRERFCGLRKSLIISSLSIDNVH